MSVVDTNIIGYLFLSSEQSLLAEDALKKDSEWAAPILWRSELRNVLLFYMRNKLIKLQHAQLIMDAALKLLRGREYEVSSYEVLRLASELLREFPAVAVSLDAFCG